MLLQQYIIRINKMLGYIENIALLIVSSLIQILLIR